MQNYVYARGSTIKGPSREGHADEGFVRCLPNLLAYFIDIGLATTFTSASIRQKPSER
jgi:hypothetical protein